MALQGTLSKFLNTRGMAPSIYEDMRAGDSGRAVDIEERAGLEREQQGHYQDSEYDDASSDAPDSQTAHERGGFLQPEFEPIRTRSRDGRKHKGSKRDKFMSRSPRMLGQDDDSDDDVPASLLIEEGEEENVAAPSRPSPAPAPKKSPNHQRAPPASRRTKADAQWQAAQAQQRLYDDTLPRPITPAIASGPRISSTNAKEVAMWQWVNVTNLDTFMGEVYEYYRGGGIWTICLGRVLDLW